MEIADLVRAVWCDGVPGAPSWWVIINAFAACSAFEYAVITALAQMPGFVGLDVLASTAMHELV
ncbi:hypothetical protein QP924_09755 [Corynebacterium pseudodiphtheriticum]|uniref:hypothetical protein n=1 Tax=Corynebacterium pseudodiphtheriticum TaxID=37637 RepID=UPI00254C094B|nr:hypothetical protein [Corynebacterium pseudodiphtheriticum]MDK8701119.1 hypothetical protein [Corynebacterium pseudodiphtheriticum]